MSGAWYLLIQVDSPALQFDLKVVLITVLPITNDDDDDNNDRNSIILRHRDQICCMKLHS